MAKSSSFITLAGIALVPDSATPLYRQLYERLRRAILSGQLAAGTRLPPTRALAVELDVSRNTVVNAFEQLMAEGYLESKVGAGTFVSHVLPEETLQVRPDTLPPTAPTPAASTKSDGASIFLSTRGADIIAIPALSLWGQPRLRAFRPGLPALDRFPFKLWEKLMVKQWRKISGDMLGYGQTAGYQPLRQAIAAYLKVARGVRCEVEQVIVVGGAQQAIDLAARLLLDPGDAVWIENPGYLGARGALRGAGARLVPVPVDAEGLNIEAGVARCPTARMVYISPSHQYPLGVTMSLSRRLALLQWAGQAKAWILEDDYDSEFRYTGRPLAALQGLDTAGRVIYIGTFSKVLAPGLRLGYLVAPPQLVDAFVAAAALSNRCPPLLTQAVLASFISEGHFARHIRQTRNLYAERQAILVEAAQNHLSGLLKVEPAEAGLHLVGWLSDEVDPQAAGQQLAGHQVEAPSLSHYALEPLPRPGLMLGYAAFSPNNIKTGAQRLAQALLAARQG